MQTSQNIEITVPLVRKLIIDQFPQWAHLEIRAVDFGGHDNRTFHLGDEMSIRLPSAQVYAAHVLKEQTWLPLLAPHLSVPIPELIALGVPSDEYPWHWSVYRWLEGQSASSLSLNEMALQQVAEQLAQFLLQLHEIEITGGPVAGEHNFWRGGCLSIYDHETRSALKALAGLIDVDNVLVVWERALGSQWDRSPVWIHGDFAPSNILIKDGKLAAVIDFGCMAVGDPACDLVIAWTFLKNKSREIFKSCMSLDEDTWARARGWVLWKALITIEQLENKQSSEALLQLQIIHDILDE